MWMLPSGKIINSPQPILIDGVNYSKNIFRKWVVEELINLGIRPFREEGFNSKWFQATAVTDTIDEDGTLVRRYTTVPRHTVEVAKGLRTKQVRKAYTQLIHLATDNENFYDAVGDSLAKKKWSDYATLLKNEAKLLKDSVNLAGTYDEIINLKFSFTPSPEEEEDGP